MAINKFYALTEGTVPSPFGPSEDFLTQDTMNLRVVDLGTLKVSTGAVVACDPFVTLADGPQFSIPNGEYPVKVTIADVSPEQDGSHQREAYLSVILGPGEAATKEPIPPLNDDFDDEGYAYVGVDAGTIAFADAGSVERYMPPESDRDAWEDIFDSDDPNSWFKLMDSAEHYEEGIANIVLPNAENGENLVLSHSGWGDGGYPVVLTRDSSGNPVGLHIDLELWASEEE